jgi:hypothetical protein
MRGPDGRRWPRRLQHGGRPRAPAHRLQLLNHPGRVVHDVGEHRWPLLQAAGAGHPGGGGSGVVRGEGGSGRWASKARNSDSRVPQALQSPSTTGVPSRRPSRAPWAAQSHQLVAPARRSRLGVLWVMGFMRWTFFRATLKASGPPLSPAAGGGARRRTACEGRPPRRCPATAHASLLWDSRASRPLTYANGLQGGRHRRPGRRRPPARAARGGRHAAAFWVRASARE